MSVCLGVCLFICLFVSNKRQNGWRPKSFCGTSRDPRESLWMIKISNICLHQNSIFIKFLKILKIHEIFCENPRIIFVLFYDVRKENMFTINLGDGREAPSKASINIFWDNKNWFIFTIKYIYDKWLLALNCIFNLQNSKNFEQHIFKTYFFNWSALTR